MPRRRARSAGDRRRGWQLVYGGGRVGLMGEVADAALAAGGRWSASSRDLMEREVGHAGLHELHVVHTMHERKQMMAERSDAFLALPGGIGTLEELFEVWTWRQLGYHDKPIGLLNVDGYYDDLLRFMRIRRRGLSAAGAACAAAGRTTDACSTCCCTGGDWPAATGRRTTIARREDRPGATSNALARLRPPPRRSRRCGCAPPARPR